MTHNQPEVMTLDEVATVLRINRSLAWRLVKAGRIRSFRTGKAYRVRRVDLEDYMVTGADFQRFIKGGPDFREKFIK